MISCSKNELPVSSFLECENFSEIYEEYTGGTIECEFYFTLAEFDGEEYIWLNSHCADLTRNIVYNRECVDICEVGPYDSDSDCGKFLAGKVDKEILLIEK